MEGNDTAFREFATTTCSGRIGRHRMDFPEGTGLPVGVKDKQGFSLVSIERRALAPGEHFRWYRRRNERETRALFRADNIRGTAS